MFENGTFTNKDQDHVCLPLPQIYICLVGQRNLIPLRLLSVNDPCLTRFRWSQYQAEP